MESSPIKMVSIELKSSSKKVGGVSLLFAFLTRLGLGPLLLMVRLTRHMATCLHFFINMKMIVLILVGFLPLADAGSSLGTGVSVLRHDSSSLLVYRALL
jgi:hypothetical protein